MSVKWLPLESNPDVMNKFLKGLGVPENWKLSDVVAMDDEGMKLLPQPSIAVIFILPVSTKRKEHVEVKEKESLGPSKVDVYFMKQTIKNACGSIALIHALANNLEHLKIPSGSFLKMFLDSTMNMTPEERGKKLEENETIANLHAAGAREGQSETPDADVDVDQHFLTLINISGNLVELDGRKYRPIFHGSTTEKNFLKDAFRVCQGYMSIDPSSVNFHAMVLGAA